MTGKINAGCKLDPCAFVFVCSTVCMSDSTYVCVCVCVFVCVCGGASTSCTFFNGYMLLNIMEMGQTLDM